MSETTTKFIEKIQVARNAWMFRFEKPKNFHFLPGQYLTWRLPHVSSDPNGSSRYFTLSVSPMDVNTLALTTEKGSSPYKQVLFNMKKGEQIHISSPMGGFYLRDTDTLPQVFLSGDIGITPFYAMITDAAKRKLTLPLTLLAQFETIDDVCFFDDLTDCAKKQKNINIIYTLTNPPSGTTWTGEKGPISQKLIRTYVPHPKHVIYSIVGSLTMVEQTQELLLSMGVPLEHIKLEEFLGY